LKYAPTLNNNRPHTANTINTNFGSNSSNRPMTANTVMSRPQTSQFIDNNSMESVVNLTSNQQ